MKGKKMSAFSLLSSKSKSQQNLNVNVVEKSNNIIKGPQNLQGRKKSSMKNGNVGLKDAFSYNDLDKSLRKELSPNKRRAISCENVTDGKSVDPSPKNRKKREMQTSTPKVKKVASTKKPRSSSNFDDISKPPPFKKSRLVDREGVQIVDMANQSMVVDSRDCARKLFDWLINPVKADKFFRELWERKPLLVKRHKPQYFKNIFSSEELYSILRENCLLYGKNIDVTSYTDGKRETHNPTGRAYPAVVRDFYQNGCSIRLLNPATFSKGVWKLNSILQEFFGSGVGANIYLTPPGAQGFAPHYDDIEAFILQLEGKKKWKLYNPRNLEETLPRFSSGNFSQEEIGEPIVDVELKPGDLMYFPRGTIHQASTPEETHSMHITVSCCQRNTWGDLLEKMLPRALQIAMEDDLDFRRALPVDYMQNLGVAFSDVKSPQRTAFLLKLSNLMKKLQNYSPIDATVDQMAKGYMHDCLPPKLSTAEKSLSIHGNSSSDKEGCNQLELEPETCIKLIRANVLRLVTEENVVRIYYSVENAREYHGEDPQFVEITPEVAPAVEHLQIIYPAFVKVEDLPLETLEDKSSIASILYERGLLITQDELPVEYDSE